ncbi:hypothetical protein ABZP36_030604 [Zizania latifolia]
MVELCSEGHALTSELAQVLAMARELEAHMDQDSVAARELCRALASSVDRSIRLARSCFPQELHAAGSPRGYGAATNPAAGRDAGFKKRKGMAKVRTQVRVTSVQDGGALDDGLNWRKYGQKDILGAKYPRAYFRCTHRHTQSCNATKQVQRTDGDPLLFDVVYLGEHTCGQAAAAAAAAKRAPPLARAEPVQLQLQLEHAGWEQQSSLLAVETGEFHQGIEPMPAGVDSYFSFVSPANSDCQFSSGFSAGSGSAGVDMDYDYAAPLEDFFLSTPEFFQSEIQNL